jgi:hypothetical protein
MARDARTDSTVLASIFAVVRVLAIAGLALIPSASAPRRVLPRWPVFAAIALAAGDVSAKLVLVHYPVLVSELDPSLTTIALCALMAWLFYGTARELTGESIDDRADRLAPNAARLFPDPLARAAFLGPIRLATDAALAFAVAITAGHGSAFRLDAFNTGVEGAALIVLVTAALFWHQRSSRSVSAAPLAAGIIAALASVASASFSIATAFSIALLPFGLAVLGIGVVAPRTTDPETRTMRRWVKLVSAMGVMFASAGFFAVYSASCGLSEPFLAKAAKIGAVVFGIMAANASARIEQHARIELAAEDRRP